MEVELLNQLEYRYKIDEFLDIDDVSNESSNNETENKLENITIKDENEKLHICFLTALKYLLKDSTLLPMDLGYFFQQYVQKCVPDNERIDLKKTSYSKLSKYIENLNEKSEEGKVVNIINVKDKISINSVNFRNKLISDFEPIYGIPNEDKDKEIKAGFSISTCFLSTKSFRKLFSDINDNVKNENKAYNLNEFKDLLLAYLKANNIQIENEKIVIDENLKQFLEAKPHIQTTPQTVKSIVTLI